ncbi:MAG: hypothetical protein ACF8GE_10495 [Phycisphaerales bacterium JB043]
MHRSEAVSSTTRLSHARLLSICSALLMLLAFSSPANGAVAFDNFDPTAPDLGNFGSVGRWHYYQTFTPTQSGYVTLVDLKGVSQVSDQGPLRINVLDGVLGNSLGFVDVPYASIPATEGTINVNFNGAGVYLVAGVTYLLGCELTIPPDNANPTGVRLELASDHLTANDDLVLTDQDGLHGTFPDLFFEIRVHVDPPVAPVGFPVDAGLRVWHRGPQAVYDVDGNTAVSSNEVLMSTTEIVPGFEHADGVYYAATRVAPTQLLSLGPGTGALNSSVALSGFPASYNLVHALESVGGTMYAMVGIAGGSAIDARLVTVNTATGAITDIGATGMGAPSGGLAYYNGVAYATTAAATPVDSNLYTVNLSTGAATLVGPVIDTATGQPINLTGLEFGYDGVLYGLNKVSFGTPPDRLYAIDTATGLAFDRGPIGPITVGQLTSLTAVPPPAPVGNGLDPELLLWKSDRGTGSMVHTIFDVDVATPDVLNPVFSPNSLNFSTGAEFANGVIYAPSSEWLNPTPMDVIDPNTGAVINTVALGTPVNVVIKSMEHVNGVMYGARFDSTGAGTDLVTVDTSTGVIVPIGPSMYSQGPAGLAYRNGTMYTATASGSNPSTLYTVDIGTGVATPVGPVVEAGVGTGVALTHIEFGLDGVLYGLARTPNDTLYSIDTANAVAYRIGFMPSVGSNPSAQATALTAKNRDPRLSLLQSNGQEDIWDLDVNAPDVYANVNYPGLPNMPGLEFGFGAFWASGAFGTNTLYKLEPGTGAILQTVPLTMPVGNVITAYEFVGTTLYGSATTSGVGNPNYLVRVDPGTGLVTNIGLTGFLGGAGGLAWDGGTMYTVNASGSGATLYTVNLGTGATATVGPVLDSSGASVALTGLEFGADGRLYALGNELGDGNRLYVIDPASGAATRLGPLPGLASLCAFCGSTAITQTNNCAGDFNGDGIVNGADLGLFLGNWGNPGITDYNNDGTTNGADLGLFLGLWGPCS